MWHWTSGVSTRIVSSQTTLVVCAASRKQLQDRRPSFHRYLEGQGDLVSGLIPPITPIVTLILPIIDLLTRDPPSTLPAIVPSTVLLGHMTLALARQGPWHHIRFAQQAGHATGFPLDV